MINSVLFWQEKRQTNNYKIANNEMCHINIL